MILDEDTILSASVAAGSGAQVLSSDFITLNPDFGLGVQLGNVNLRKAPMPNLQEFGLHFRVTTAFAINAGLPLAEFHAALSDGTDEVNIGSNAPAITLVVGARIQWGFLAAQLTLNAQFFVRFAPWSAIMGRTSAGAALLGRDLNRLYAHVALPASDVATFSAGTVEARVVKMGDIVDSPDAFIYPAGTQEV